MPKEMPKISQTYIESWSIWHTMHRDDDWYINYHALIDQLIWGGGGHDPLKFYVYKW